MKEECQVRANADTARAIAALIERAIVQERRACAAIAEELGAKEQGHVAHQIAERILARGD